MLQSGRYRMATSRTSPPLRRLLRRALLIALAGPLAVILLFRFAPVPITPLMAIRAVQGHGIDRDWVALEAIAPALPQAVIAAEDNFFCEQMLGFDTQALRTELARWWDGDRPRGASTITMQTAKNLFLWPGRDPLRKVIEAWLTPQVALLWPRQRVLEVYLNIVEFGPGIYGAEAAARAFFGKPARRLTQVEAALLAAVLPNPLERSPQRPGAQTARRAEIIMLRMSQLGPLLACAGPPLP